MKMASASAARKDRFAPPEERTNGLHSARAYRRSERRSARRAVRRKLSHINLGQRAVVSVVLASHGRHHVWRSVVVVVPEIAPLAGQARRALDGRSPPPARNDVEGRVRGPEPPRDELVVGWVALARHVPLLVANLNAREAKRRGVPHPLAHRRPRRRGWRGVCEVEHVDRVLRKGLRLRHGHVPAPHRVAGVDAHLARRVQQLAQREQLEQAEPVRHPVPPRRVVVACPRGGRPERGLPVPTSAHPSAFKVVSARCTHEARPRCLQPLEGIAPEETADGVRRDQRDGIEPERGRPANVDEQLEARVCGRPTAPRPACPRATNATPPSSGGPPGRPSLVRRGPQRRRVPRPAGPRRQRGRV
mmetsp:Transcript_35632/g.104705  ORF Transcript_35632/g.104705 Transcript_35632/m.104705 type:complete len:361 (+) Transcript_35632:839-1921(+)